MPNEQKELANMMEAAAEVEARKAGKPQRVGLPRNHEPWKELSEAEAMRVLQEAAAEVDAGDTGQSRQGDTPPERKPDRRYARLDRAFEETEKKLEAWERRERTATDERIDKQLEEWGF